MKPNRFLRQEPGKFWGWPKLLGHRTPKGSDELTSSEIGAVRSELSGYRNAYEVTAEELGEARLLLLRYQKLLDAASADKIAQRRPAPSDLPEDVGAFLILGNGRSGSTWLLTSADSLSGVVARREINWRQPGRLDHRNQSHIDGLTVSMRQAIAAAIDIGAYPGQENAQLRIAGGKLIYDLYGYTGPEVFGHIEKITEASTRIISLRRRYMDWWLSWMVRSIRHEIDVGALRRVNPAGWARELALLTVDGDPTQQEIVLTLGGRPLHDPSGMNNPVHYPLRNAIDDMLMGFYNDLMSAAIARSRHGMIIEYEEIESRLHEFAAFIGSSAAPEEIEAIRSAPVTKKLAILPPTMVGPSDILPELSDLLVRLRSDEAVWTWESRNVVVIRSFELAKFLKRLGLDPTGASVGLAPASDPEAVKWRVRKPVYSL